MNYKRTHDLIIDQALNQNRIKGNGEYYESHHIVPRSLGGRLNKENLVLLTAREHYLIHWLLTKIYPNDVKLRHAFSMFARRMPYRQITSRQFERAKLELLAIRPRFNTEKHEKGVKVRKRNGSYKTGSDNHFSSPEIKSLVKQRMISSNPMKDEKQRERMRVKNNNPKVRQIQTSDGVFASINEAARFYNTSAHLFKKDFSFSYI